MGRRRCSQELSTEYMVLAIEDHCSVTFADGSNAIEALKNYSSILRAQNKVSVQELGSLYPILTVEFCKFPE